MLNYSFLNIKATSTSDLRISFFYEDSLLADKIKRNGITIFEDKVFNSDNDYDFCCFSEPKIDVSSPAIAVKVLDTPILFKTIDLKISNLTHEINSLDLILNDYESKNSFNHIVRNKIIQSTRKTKACRSCGEIHNTDNPTSLDLPHYGCFSCGEPTYLFNKTDLKSFYRLNVKLEKLTFKLSNLLDKRTFKIKHSVNTKKWHWRIIYGD